MTNSTKIKKSAGAKGARGLRHMRLAMGMTLERVAKETRINLATMSFYERGYRKPTADHAHLLAEFYGVPVSEFWTPPKL